jgi:hypothetical protein
MLGEGCTNHSESQGHYLKASGCFSGLERELTVRGKRGTTTKLLSERNLELLSALGDYTACNPGTMRTKKWHSLFQGRFTLTDRPSTI